MTGSADDLPSWLRLERTPGVGPETARKLLGHFGLPSNLFQASHPELAAIAGERIARTLLADVADDMRAQIERTLAWAAQPGNHVLTLADPAYPRALLDIGDPPLILYAKGRVDLMAAPSVAVVGSRNATNQGLLNAEAFSESLSKAGFAIISGLALGIDTAAHRGGLCGTGSTIAVIGTGIDIVYPARNRALAHEIAEKGCLISEYPLGMPAVASNFPRRNRIISGLSKGVLVVEAAARSGSLITARMAGEQGRDVFAIPGSIHAPLSKGCHLLIKQGAKLVECSEDVLEELGHRFNKEMPCGQPELAEDVSDSPLFAVLGFDPVAPEQLAHGCNMDMGAVQAQLLTLEMEGAIEMLPGGMVRRIALP